jgi:hypothetical protein
MVQKGGVSAQPSSALPSFLSLDFLSGGGRPSTSSQGQEEEGRTDLDGLVQYLTQLRMDNSRLVEITYAINAWSLGGFIPMSHHGFAFATSKGEFFTLDFGRKGIVWDIYDELPEMPDNTYYTKVYKVDMDTRAIQRYCQETPPFNFPFYDCETWAKGLLAALGLDKVPDASPGGSKSQTSAQKNGSNRRQRSGTCV